MANSKDTGEVLVKILGNCGVCVFLILVSAQLLGDLKFNSLQSLSDDTIETRASLFQKSIGFGDACTYRLIAKNVTNLLTKPQQPLKQETLKSLTDLIK